MAAYCAALILCLFMKSVRRKRINITTWSKQTVAPSAVKSRLFFWLENLCCVAHSNLPVARRGAIFVSPYLEFGCRNHYATVRAQSRPNRFPFFDNWCCRSLSCVPWMEGGNNTHLKNNRFQMFKCVISQLFKYVMSEMFSCS